MSESKLMLYISLASSMGTNDALNKIDIVKATNSEKYNNLIEDAMSYLNKNQVELVANAYNDAYYNKSIADGRYYECFNCGGTIPRNVN